jgi:hypothetical protein
MVPTKDMKYGSFNETSGKWNGIIGMLQRKEIDFSLMDLTILAERSQVLQFFQKKVQEEKNLAFHSK